MAGAVTLLQWPMGSPTAFSNCAAGSLGPTGRSRADQEIQRLEFTTRHPGAAFKEMDLA